MEILNTAIALHLQSQLLTLQIAAADWKGPGRYPPGTMVDGKNVGGQWMPSDKSGSGGSGNNLSKSGLEKINNLASSFASRLKELTVDKVAAIAKAATHAATEIGDSIKSVSKKFKRDFKKGVKVFTSALSDAGKFLDKHKTSIGFCAAAIGLGVLSGYLFGLACADFAASTATIGVFRTIGIISSLESQSISDAVLLAFSAGTKTPVGRVAIGLAKLNIAGTLLAFAGGAGILSWVSGKIGASAQDPSFQDIAQSLLKEARADLLGSAVTGAVIAQLIGLKNASKDMEAKLLKAFQDEVSPALAEVSKS